MAQNLDALRLALQHSPDNAPLLLLFAEGCLEEGLVEEAIPGLPTESLGIYAVYPPGRFTQPKVRAFIDFLARQLIDKGPDSW